MSTLADQPAFPRPYAKWEEVSLHPQIGMTIRQFAAIELMKGYLSADWGSAIPSEAVEKVMEYADALMEKLERTKA